MLPWPVWPLAGQSGLGQNTVARSMSILLALSSGLPRVWLDLRFCYKSASPRFSAELPDGTREVLIDCWDPTECNAGRGGVSHARRCRTDRPLSGHAVEWGDRLPAVRRGAEANRSATRNPLRPGERFAERDYAILPGASRDLLRLRHQA